MNNNQPVIIPASAERGAWINALRSLRFRPNEFISNRAVLRLERPLAAGKNSYTFNMYSNPGSDRPLERKLNRNDVFALTGIGLFITRQDTANDDYGTYPLYSYPEEDIFVGANGGTNRPEFAALRCLYNGKISIKTESMTTAQEIGTELLQYVPTTQTPSATTAQPGWGGADGKGAIYNLEPILLFNGQKNNTINLDLGTGDTTLIAGGIDASGDALDPVVTNVAVLLLEGFLFNSAAEAQVAR